MSWTDRFNNPGYKNWLRVGIALQVTRDGLVHVALQAANKLHAELKAKLGDGVENCSCNTKKGQECEDCAPWREELKRNYYIGEASRIGWSNCTPSKWSKEPWEVAKVFMPKDPTADNTGPEKSDPAALLNFLIHCTYCKKYVSVKPSQKVIEVRNKAMHSKDLTFDRQTFNEYMDKMDRLLRLVKDPLTLAADITAKKAADEILKIKKGEFHIGPNKDCLDAEIRVLREFMGEQEQLLQLHEEQLEDHGTRLDTLEKSIPPVEEVLQTLLEGPILDIVNNNPDLQHLKDQAMALSTIAQQLQDRLDQLEETVAEHGEQISDVQERLDQLEVPSRSTTFSRGMTLCTMAIVLICLGAPVYFLQPSKSTADGASLLALFPRRMKTFVGREDVFSRIDTCLQGNQTCLIKGLGGVGKTSVAIEYGHRQAQKYPSGVFWLKLASKPDLCASMIPYNQSLSVLVSGDEPVKSNTNNDLRSCESVKNLLKLYLTRSEGWLLVADEAARRNMTELGSLLPHNLKENMHVLLTSREGLMLDSQSIPVVNLLPFNETEAQEMFNRTVRPSSKKDRKEIKHLAGSLGHHPLALQFAFAYIKATDCSVKEYHDKYTQGNATEKVDLLDEEGIDRTIRRLFDITFQYISQLSSKASYSLKLLDMTSFMGPDCIPCPEPDNEHFSKLINISGKLDKLDIKKMISVLKKFSLASDCSAFYPCAFSVNRIVQEVIVAQMNESTKLSHLENALEYSTLLLRQSDDTSVVQSELLMAHVHHLALNVERYQTKISVNSSCIFLNKSAEFFSQWGACAEAYYFLHVEQLLLFRHNSTLQNLCYHLRDHVNFLQKILLPCLYSGNVSRSSAFMGNIAENLFWAGLMLEKKSSSYSIEDAWSTLCFDVKESLERTTLYIYKSLFQLIPDGKLADLNMTEIAPSLLFKDATGYRLRMEIRQLNNYYARGCQGSTTCTFDTSMVWNLFRLTIALAGIPLRQAAHELNWFFDLIGFDTIEFCSQVPCSDKSTADNEVIIYCCDLIETIRSELRDLRSTVENSTSSVNMVLLEYYQLMDTSTCTNRYYEVMLGLPRENKEFDILEFAYYEGNELLGDPGVVKSVLSQKANAEKGSRNPGAVSPLSYLAFHQQVKWKYQLATKTRQLRQAIDENIAQGADEDQLNVFPIIQNCSVLSVTLAEVEKYSKTTLTQLRVQVLDQFLSIFKVLLGSCHRLQSINNRMLDAMDLIRDKKEIKKFREMFMKHISDFSHSLSELVKVIHGNHFVTSDCMCFSPSIRSVFGCENVFPFILWVWNVQQIMTKNVDCSLDHPNLNLSCFSNLMSGSKEYVRKTLECFFPSKENMEMQFGQPISDGGENFKFYQRDSKVVGLADYSSTIRHIIHDDHDRTG
ncbi:PREDICTED: uncharacterized protein LOC109462772 [Branchiostoma belcheri]|uniref:Uncharacterized protein LOC109462772 n=1 Tax=Branchiostoma belcheri TaxID=7741 RepID=A0A6P4XS97_BRABE|nr:PREDICTED: uncharacterized protein LOC109462772 [Branchiostoma belcheri]